MIKAFDVYFYDTFIKEGASVAILEALACGVPVMCKPLGGNMELVKHGVNGFLYHDYAEAQRFLKMLASDRGRLVALKQSTQTDFANRLHIKRLVKEYTREFGNVQA
jgi:glycosyltransferase involved in cell wall biosynthesis